MATPPPLSPPLQSTGIAAPATGAAPARCMHCGYELTGLAPDGKCPECGVSVADSMRSPLLLYSDPPYVAKLHLGVFLVLASIIAQILVTFIGVGGSVLLGVVNSSKASFSHAELQTILTIVLLPLTAAQLYGWWLFSEPDPRYEGLDRGDRWRAWVRNLVIAAMVVACISTATQFLGIGILTIVVSVLGTAIWVGRFIAEMKYLAWLAPRLPNTNVAKRASKLMWLGPVLYTVGILLLGLGPLIALVMYWNLLDVVRKDLKRVRSEQGLQAAAAAG